ncbi:MAG: biotin/lipoyl-containing protein [Christensenellaceae bacterium]
MDLQSVLELLKAVESTGWSKFEIKEDEFSMKLERNTGGSEQVFVQPSMAMPLVQNTVSAAPIEAKDNSKEIPSPLVGVYHKLAEGGGIKIGDRVRKGDVICLIEAMKLMNEITMPEDGEIVWVSCEDGESVEYGQLLFKYVV